LPSVSLKNAMWQTPVSKMRLAGPELVLAVVVGTQPERLDVEAAAAVRVLAGGRDEVDALDHRA
jgi:hypothetical protein